MTEDNIVQTWIEWDVPSPPTRSRLVVDERIRKPYEAGDYRADMRPATPDDLRAACAAAGLVASTVAYVAAEDALFDSLRDALTTEKARAEKAEASERTVYANLIGRMTELREALGVPDDADALAYVRALTDGTRLEELTAERDALRTKLAAAEGQTAGAMARAKFAEDEAAAVREERKRAVARAEAAESRLSALTAPVEGEPSDEALAEAWNAAHGSPFAVAIVAGRRAVWRAGYAACAARTEEQMSSLRAEVAKWQAHAAAPLYSDKFVAAARHQPTEPRPGVGDLGKTFYAARRAFGEKHPHLGFQELDAAGLRAVRDMLRAERPACLVERAVAKGLSLYVMPEDEFSVNIELRADDGTGESRKVSERVAVPTKNASVRVAEMLTEVGA